MFSFLRRLKRFNYPGIEPPSPFKPRPAMNAIEAQQYFQWFTGLSQIRCKLLFTMVGTTGGSACCDYTFDSLIPLWNFTSRLFETRQMTPEQKAWVVRSNPDAAKQSDEEFVQLSTATGCLAIDIGFYVAEIFLRKHPNMHWAICEDERGPKNEPIVAGFKACFVPCDLVVDCVWRHLRHPNDRILNNAVIHWETNNILPDFR